MRGRRRWGPFARSKDKFGVSDQKDQANETDHRNQEADELAAGDVESIAEEQGQQAS